MADEYVEYLKNDERRMAMALLLFDYARNLLARDHGWTPRTMLPGGIDPEDIVFEIFDRVARGKRKFNKAHSHEVQLKGMVRSLISKLYELKDAKLQTIDLPEDDASYPQVEKALGIGGPDSPFEREEYSKRFFELLEEHPKVKKNPDLGIVIMAYVDGASGSAEAARETGIPVKQIYEHNRSLLSILPEVQTKLK
jgi:hypothetical protein